MSQSPWVAVSWSLSLGTPPLPLGDALQLDSLLLTEFSLSYSPFADRPLTPPGLRMVSRRSDSLEWSSPLGIAAPPFFLLDFGGRPLASKLQTLSPFGVALLSDP